MSDLQWYPLKLCMIKYEQIFCFIKQFIFICGFSAKHFLFIRSNKKLAEIRLMFQGYRKNRALPSLHDGSFEITLTVPLMETFKTSQTYILSITYYSLISPICGENMSKKGAETFYYFPYLRKSIKYVIWMSKKIYNHPCIEKTIKGIFYLEILFETR